MSEGWTPCVVALGTNLGDREELAARALADIRATEGFRVTAASSLHETIALHEAGPSTEAPRYLNQIVLLDSAWSPERTLALLFGIEHGHGRVRGSKRYADRTLDLDLIVYGDLESASPEVTLPHPRAHERRFVLEPWLEVDSTAHVPGKGAVVELLAALPLDTP